MQVFFTQGIKKGPRMNPSHTNQLTNYFVKIRNLTRTTSRWKLKVAPPTQRLRRLLRSWLYSASTPGSLPHPDKSRIAEPYNPSATLAIRFVYCSSQLNCGSQSLVLCSGVIACLASE